MKKSTYLPGVDGLRAIAVLSVVLFHGGMPHFAGGFVGVDVFFVISGFLITRLIADEIHATGRFDFGGFYVRRARRLFPALFVIFVCCFVAAFLLFTAQHFQRFGGELLYAMTSLSNVFFWSENGYFNTASDFKPLLHTWSLSVEEQFYLIWPAILYLLLRRTGKRGVWASLLTIGAASLYLNVLMQNGFSSPLLAGHQWVSARLADGASTIFFLTPFRLFEFSIGAALVWVKPAMKLSRWQLEVGMVVGLALIAYSIFRFDQRTVFPSVNALIPCLGAALVILAADAALAGLVVRNRVSVFIGKISYSVYLVHWPMLVFYKYWRIVPTSIAERSVLIAASLGAGYLLFRFVETPFRSGENGPRLSRAGVGFACSSSLLVMSLLSATVWANDGFPWRIAPMPPDIAAQAANSKEFQVDQYGGAEFPGPTTWMGAPSNGRADFVFIGDSHAGQYKAGFKQDIVDPLKKSVFFSTASCLILPGMTRNTPGTDWDHWCTKALNDALDVINRSPDATVVMAESWDFQISYAAMLDTKEAIYKNGDMDAALKVVGARLDALRALIGNRRLVLMGEVPGAGVKDPIGCFMRPKYIKTDCDDILTTAERDNPARKINRFLKTYASEHPNVTFLNPFSVLCDGGQCHTVQGGRVLYSDDYHLSKFGSIVVIKALAPQLAGAEKLQSYAGGPGSALH